MGASCARDPTGETELMVEIIADAFHQIACLAGYEHYANAPRPGVGVARDSKSIIRIPMLTIPSDFAAYTAARAGEAGRDWLQSLPAMFESLCARWRLVPDGAVMHGGLSVVVPVRRGDEPCVLKLGWVDETTAHEAAALAAWNGHGAVRLLEAEPETGALLLERLDSARSLQQVALPEAVRIAGAL